MDLTPLTQPINELTTPVSKSAGETLKDVWDLVFGGFGTFVDKKRIQRQKDLADFRDNLFNEVSDIPEENIKEPQLSVIGPALEASKYYYEEPELRNMFAKLVAGSMDDRKNIHPCFIEIIKQLSPHDAKMLTLFAKNTHQPICNISEYVSQDKKSFTNSRNNIFISAEFPDIRQNQVSLTSLDRSSLIKISFTEWYSDDAVYDRIKELCGIKKLNDEIGWEKFHLTPGIARITPLGKDFISVCL